MSNDFRGARGQVVQGSLLLTKNPGLSRTTWKIFQDIFGAFKCLIIKKNVIYFNIQRVVRCRKFSMKQNVDDSCSQFRWTYLHMVIWTTRKNAWLSRIFFQDKKVSADVDLTQWLSEWNYLTHYRLLRSISNFCTQAPPCIDWLYYYTIMLRVMSEMSHSRQSLALVYRRQNKANNLNNTDVHTNITLTNEIFTNTI